jgi:Rrf2 family protein
MRLSSMADYAVVIMAAASRHCGCAIRETGGENLRVRLSAGQLAKETGLPAPTVQKLVSRLVSGGLLHSTRGAGGGIRLARPAAAITLADIVEAVEGPIAMTACLEEGRHDCTLEDACSVRGHWPIVNEVLRVALAGVPLTRLAEASE